MEVQVLSSAPAGIRFSSTMPQKSPSETSVLPPIKRILDEYGRQHWPQYALALGFMVVVAVCTSLSAWLMKDLTNSIFVDKDRSQVMFFPALISAIFIIKGIFAYLQEVTLAKVGMRITADLQSRIYNHFLAMDLEFFRRWSSGDLVARFNQGATNARQLIQLVAVSLGRDLLTVLGLCAVMIFQDPIMFLIVVVTAPIAALALKQLSKRAKKASQVTTDILGTVVSLSRETAQGAKMIKSFQLENLMRKKMGSAISITEQAAVKLVRVRAAVAPLSEILAGLAIAGVILYGVMRADADPQMIGRFFSFITALLLAGEPLRRLSRLHVDLATAAVPVTMMYELLDEPEDSHERAKRPPLKVSAGEITFENVRFQYQHGPEVLKAIDVTFEGQKTTALVGPSGGGKTTILGLIQGLYRPSEGHIKIDGANLDEVSLASLRSQVAFLDQEAFLFEGTIAENIRGGDDSMGRDAMISAAKAANAHEFIERTPDGYNSEINELAANFSGGQKQRLAVARAFFKDAPILLLDEPTSALDSESEQILQSSIRDLSKGRTTVLIAHRLSTAQHADRIYVIEDGTAVESGTHDELIARDGRYAALYRLQFAGNGRQGED